MTDISTNKIGHLNTTTDIQNTIQMVLELPISDCNKMFFENLLTFTRQDPLNIDTKTSLVTGLSLFLDYFFINSFKNQTNDFEEFLKMDCVERDLLDNDRRVIFESPKSPDNIKLQVQKSVLQAGQKYSLGETDMKVIEIKDNGVLYLL